jgi:hypothetical protein
LRDIESWLDLQQELRPIEAFRPADMSQVMILVAGVPAPSGGYAVRFESIEKSGDDIVAVYALQVPGHDCMTVSALTFPFEAVMVRRTDGAVRFERRLEHLSCST